ncbi:MAG TPA: YceI family protein [Cyclobacteriaceae bacterium]|nr:YceI family protein [Cyclobacteriaceae bacterium]HRJ81810.1 YceI family protein [Cyclobacteriaceae bacterium]
MFRLIIIFWVLVNPTLNAQHTYVVEDTPGNVSFSIRNFGLNVRGDFSNITGKARFDPHHSTNSSFEVSIPVKTISTGIALRDKHLLKEDYFYAQKHPVIRFISETVNAGDEEDLWILQGRLSIKGVTKSVTIPLRVKLLHDNQLHFSSEFKLNRIDFGVGGRSLSLSDEVTAIVNVVASQQAP